MQGRIDPLMDEGESPVIASSKKTYLSREWYFTISLVKQVETPRTVLNCLESSFKSGSFSSLKSCLQSLFRDMSRPDPVGTVGFFTEGRICLIKVIGPLGEKDPIYSFETKSINGKWEVRDADTKTLIEPSSLIAEDYVFSEGEGEKKRRRRPRNQVVDLAIIPEIVAESLSEPSLIDAGLEVISSMISTTTEAASTCVETGVELACSAAEAAGEFISGGDF